MTAELLGWIDALSALVKTLHVTTLGRPKRIVLRAEQGFTLTELLVAVTVVGVLSAIAAPSLSAMIATQQVRTATVDLYAALSYARSEAIKRNSVVSITPHDGNFAKGYDLGAGGVVLRSELGSPTVAITAPGGIALAFDGFGRLTTPASYRLELSSTKESSLAKRCLVISSAGRPSIRVDSDHDGNCING
jgi:type IV fimbrial biogenesis protein FimT